MLQVASDLNHHGFRVVHSSEEPLEGNNLPSVILVLGCSAAIFDEQATVSMIRSIAGRCPNAHVCRNAGEQEVPYSHGAKKRIDAGRSERAVGGLVDYGFTWQRFNLLDDLMFHLSLAIVRGLE